MRTHGRFSVKLSTFCAFLLENTHLFYALFDKQMKPYLHSGRDHLIDVVLHYALGQDCCIGPLLLKQCVEKEKKITTLLILQQLREILSTFSCQNSEKKLN